MQPRGFVCLRHAAIALDDDAQLLPKGPTIYKREN